MNTYEMTFEVYDRAEVIAILSIYEEVYPLKYWFNSDYGTVTVVLGPIEEHSDAVQLPGVVESIQISLEINEAAGYLVGTEV